MRPDSTLSDAALDRELEQAFAVDPSPEFVARVRARIVDEAPRRWAWNRTWSFASGAIAAIAIIAVAIQLSNRRALPSTAAAVLEARAVAPAMGVLMDPAARTGAVPASPPVAAVPIPVGRPRELPQESRGRAVQAIALASDHAAGEVLLDPRETAALQALIARVRTGRLDLGPAMRATVPRAMDLPPIDDIVISPITIEPLAPAGAEGVRQ